MNSNNQKRRPVMQLSDLTGIIGAVVAGLGLWILALVVFDVPPYLLPSPIDVVHEVAKMRAQLALDFLVTGLESLIGFVLSTIFSLYISIQLQIYQKAEKYVLPVLVVVKSVPVVALAPLLGYWLGYGYGGKVFVAALISFFPLVINTISGMRDVNQEQIDFFNVAKASRWDEILRLRLPHSLPSIFSAMRIAGPLSVVGAVVAEMLGARQGLGHTLMISSMTLDIPLNFAALFATSLLGVIIFYGILFTERYVLRRFRLSSQQNW